MKKELREGRSEKRQRKIITNRILNSRKNHSETEREVPNNTTVIKGLTYEGSEFVADLKMVRSKQGIILTSSIHICHP